VLEKRINMVSIWVSLGSGLGLVLGLSLVLGLVLALVPSSDLVCVPLKKATHCGLVV